MAGCGCRIVSGDERTEYAPFGLKIEYCSLHAAAEQMRDALTRAKTALVCSDRSRGSYDCFTPAPVNVPCRQCEAKRAAREALAAAEAN